MIVPMTTYDRRKEEAGRTIRPWPVTILGLLLLLQAAGLLVVGLYTLTLPPDLLQTFITQPADLAGLVFTFLAPLALWASAGFLRRWRNAWLNAMLLQGLCLAMALAIYFSHGRLVYVYLAMAYAVFMVIYLNHYEVQEAFRTRPVPEEEL
jgi:lysylphosphatidylglycerol synthetase-like protein (DUF2156 family)